MNATVSERDVYTAIAMQKVEEHFARLGQMRDGDVSDKAVVRALKNNY